MKMGSFGPGRDIVDEHGACGNTSTPWASGETHGSRANIRAGESSASKPQNTSAGEVKRVDSLFALQGRSEVFLANTAFPSRPHLGGIRPLHLWCFGHFGVGGWAEGNRGDEPLRVQDSRDFCQDEDES